MTITYMMLPGTPPVQREGEEPTQAANIPAGSLTAAQADQFVTELTRARVTNSIAVCDAEIADWNRKDAAMHDVQLYIDAAKAQEKAIPFTGKNDPNHLANEARRSALLAQIDEWTAAKTEWTKASQNIATIQKRRDASMVYLNSMPPKPPSVVGYPSPATPRLAFVVDSANWPPPHVDPITGEPHREGE